MNLQSTLILITLLLITSCSSSEIILDTEENRLIAVDGYLQVIPPAELFGDIISSIAKNVPAAQREDFIVKMNYALPIDELTEIMKTNIIKHFTVNEIIAMTNFYSTEEGKSSMKKLGAYTADIMPEIQKLVMKAMNMPSGQN